MTKEQMIRARMKFGLTLDQMAHMLGYDGEHARKVLCDIESGRRRIRDAQRRLLEAYLAGYRPKDWPQ